ncbi:MAG: hypothetical protein K9G24_08690 [Candidatus Nanopelagicales bacterium]|nr:hypothetical protein [Candidatus Nanopelagicales bacterium]MCF8538137.1 hypothetical protein [Candidatus Nanopelagicales bacterium]MCF8543142.1 hypothetical protein [Candidatus Nanopelagicales bacterium]MCF8556578.1 hypothetical protein [Candidatus Nanopelagicales bacterium]
MASRPTLRERVGGRWAVSWQGYLLMFPLAVVFAVTTTAAFLEPGRLLFGTAVAVIAYLATGAVQFVASITVLGNRATRPAPVWSVILIGGLSWMARSAVIAWVIADGNLITQATTLERLAFGFLLGALVVPVTAWLFDTVMRFRNKRDAALQELIDAELAAERQRAYVEALRLGLVEEITQAVGNARARMESIDLTSDAMPQEALEALENASQDAVRRVSREVWRQGVQTSRPRIRDVFSVAGRVLPFSLWAVASMLLFGVLVLARNLGWGTTLLVASVVGAYLVAVVLLANAWVPRARHVLRAYAMALLALAASGACMSVVLGVFAPDAPRSAAAVLTVVAATVTIPAVGLARALDVTEDRAILALREFISAASVRAEALAEQERRLRQQLATQLHGTVGSHLTAATMRMRRAVDAGDFDAAANALFEARRLLDVDMTSVLLADVGDLMTALEELAASWEGLVEVRLHLNDVIASPAHVTACVDVVTEGINNAARHGRARVVDVEVTSTDDGLRIVLEDDGTESGDASPGLGSRVFDAVAPGSWSRERRSQGGSRLIVDLR